MLPFRAALLAGAGGGSIPPAYGLHAYWRLFVTNNNGSASFISLAELEFLDGSGTLIPATGGTAIASSVNAGSSASNAFDSSIASSWAATSGIVTNSWIGYQFSSPVGVESIRLGTKTANPEQTPKDCTLQYSDDGSSWSDAFSLSNTLWVPGAYTVFPETLASGYHRAWRLFVSDNDGTTSNIFLSEMEMRATAGGADQTANVGTGSADGRVVFSTQLAGNEAYRLFNNATGTDRWVASTSTDAWVGFIFPNPVKIEEIALTAPSNTPATRNPSIFTLDYSDDGTSWTTQKSFATQTGWSIDETRVLAAI